MIFGRGVAKVASRGLDQVRRHIALRGATQVGPHVRVFGWPRIACEGELVIGRGVVLVSSPAPINLLVEAGAKLVIGDGVLIESGAILRACGHLVVGSLARIGVGCIIDDERSEGGGIDISPGAWVEDGAVLLGGGNVSAEGLTPETTRSAGGQANGSVDGGHGPADDERRIRAVVSRVVPPAKEARGDEDLSRIKGWDSLCALRILVALEHEFHVSLPPDLLAAQPRIDSLAKAISASASVRSGAQR